MRSIMIQGTMSNVGKSLLTAGLCRILKQDGIRTAPFKAQNMALNSFVTADGLEMGRAQVMQAEAAGIEPAVEMNPILLKPSSDTGSQVIVNGEVLANMDARTYFAYKKELVPVVSKAYEKLKNEYDCVLIEGAGSPAEINLKSADLFVNMDMAKMADASVLLVGDIDRGGVFAQLIGTLMLLEPEERARIKGLIINKFRGDPSLMEDGVRMLEEKAGIPVLGIVPYMQIALEDEDSLGDRLNLQSARDAQIVIGVIRYPRISNYTDFLVYDMFEAVQIKYVTNLQDLSGCDMLILPGSKDTIGDLRWMKACGIASGIMKAAADEIPIFGICGGYQMLGTMIKDPSRMESGGKESGLGLLPIETVFSEEKRRMRVNGRIGELTGILSSLSGLFISGYEIHMGKTEGSGKMRFCHIHEAISESGDTLQKTNASDFIEELPDGYHSGNIYGTYLHGVFDAEGIVDGIIKALAKQKGVELQKENKKNFQEFKEIQYDLLAKHLRESLDMDVIYRLLEEK